MSEERGILSLLLASSLTCLASLYMTWVVGTPVPAKSGNGILGLLNLFEGFSWNGWGEFGQAAALMALALATVAVIALARPERELRVPLAALAFALLFFAVANLLETRGSGLIIAGFDHDHVHVRYGAYVGIASAAIACLGATGLQWDELAPLPSLTTVITGGLTLGLLAAFLLPWLHVHVPHTHSVTGVARGYQVTDTGSVTAGVALGIACLGLPFRRPIAAAAVAVLTVGVFSPLGTHMHWPYEAWLAIGCSLGLVAVAIVSGRSLRSAVPSIAMLAGTALLLASLFLPWDKSCLQRTCLVTNGWSGSQSSMAGGLAAILVVIVACRRRFSIELVTAIAIYVPVTGLAITASASLGYGAVVGFAGTGILLLAAVPQVRRVDLRWQQLVPIAACVAFLAVPVATLTRRLPFGFEIDSPWRLSLLEAAAILVALRLLGRWLGGPANDDERLLLPFALLALTGLDLGYVQRIFFISWEGWLLVGLSALLCLLGWGERTGRLESFRIPEEIWRVDRLPGAED